MIAGLICGRNLRAGCKRTKREPVGNALRGDQNIRRDPIMLDGKHLPGASETALDLVGDEEYPVSVENSLDLAEIMRRGNNDAALPKHRFGNKGCNVA